MTQPELSKVDIAVYALDRLGGYQRKFHTEEIAYKAYEIAKERFSWKLAQFRERGFPDKEPVRSALMDAAKKKYGSLVEGRSGVEAKGKDTDGWRLTPSGAAWVRENKDRIEQALGQAHPQTRTMDAARFRRQIVTQPLFRKFVKRGELTGESPYALTDMLNTSPDAPKETVSMKFTGLRSSAEFVGDEEVLRFLDACVRAFPGLLTEDAANRDERSKGQ
jgi:hypothetical protein